MALLRSSAANKYRSRTSDDIVCCLEISNNLLYFWHLSLKMGQQSIVSQLNTAGVKTDDKSLGVIKPYRFSESGSNGDGSLEQRLYSNL